jgi:hypothetical protein
MLKRLTSQKGEGTPLQTRIDTRSWTIKSKTTKNKIGRLRLNVFTWKPSLV